MLVIAVGTPVTVVCTSGPIPVFARAAVIRADGDQLDFELADDAALAVGAQVIVELPDEMDAPRAIVEVAALNGRRLETRLVRLAVSERREYPRLEGVLSVRYRVLASNGAGMAVAAAWLRGEDVGGAEYVPDSYMNFSATGLAFDGGEHARGGDTILVGFSLPPGVGGAGSSWRCTARAVRVWPIPADELDSESSATHRTALVFEAISPAATSALTEYTIRIQDALLLGAIRTRQKRSGP